MAQLHAGTNLLRIGRFHSVDDCKHNTETAAGLDSMLAAHDQEFETSLEAEFGKQAKNQNATTLRRMKKAYEGDQLKKRKFVWPNYSKETPGTSEEMIRASNESRTPYTTPISAYQSADVSRSS